MTASLPALLLRAEAAAPSGPALVPGRGPVGLTGRTRLHENLATVQVFDARTAAVALLIDPRLRPQHGRAAG